MAADAGDIDDGAFGRFEVGPGGSGEADGAEELEGEAVLPVVIGEGFEFAAPGGAGIVDEDVEGAVGIESELDEAGGVDGIAEVQGDGGSRAAGISDLGDGRLQGHGVARTQDNAGSVLSEPESDGAADA